MENTLTVSSQNYSNAYDTTGNCVSPFSGSYSYWINPIYTTIYDDKTEKAIRIVKKLWGERKLKTAAIEKFLETVELVKAEL